MFSPPPWSRSGLGSCVSSCPKSPRVGVLFNPNSPSGAWRLRDIQDAAQALGQQIAVLKAATEPEIDSSFAAMKHNGIGAVLIAADPFFTSRRDQILGLAARYELPAIYYLREFTAFGGLASYGASLSEAFRQVGIYTARILKGEKPGDLPIMQPTKFDFVINLKTAKALGLNLPPMLLALADEVID